MPSVYPFVLAILLSGTPPQAQQARSARESGQRIVVGSYVQCRTAPDLAATVVNVLGVGETFEVEERTSAESPNTLWHRGTVRRFRGPSCWVHSSLTMPFEESTRKQAVLAIAERTLGLIPRPEFAHYVAVENLMREISPDPIENVSPLFALRYLEIVNEAGSVIPQRNSLIFDPLAEAWFLRHQDQFAFHGLGNSWHLRPDVFWDLYERRQNTDEGDLLAWTAARRWWMGGECEGDPACIFSFIINGPMRYWTLFPDGAYISEALDRAIPWARSVDLNLCYFGPPPLQVLAEVEASLDPVRSPEKDDLLGHLVDIRVGGNCPEPEGER